MDYDKKKVILGLSGGVDSGSTVLELEKLGYKVIGLYFDIKEATSQKCPFSKGHKDALEVAKQLGIELIYKNPHLDFNNIVVRDFVDQYTLGRTPNPCIVCNPTIKFPTLIDEANSQKAYYISTGHYGRTKLDEETGCWHIRKAANVKKDQSYMLYRLPESTISRLLMPLGQIDDKEKVRQIARENNLVNADKKDSQEICFIDGSYIDYLEHKSLIGKPGDFVDLKGNVLGEHQGLERYTVGQRKGLGIAFGQPMYVVALDSDKNQVILGENQDLFNNVVPVSNCFFTETSSSVVPESLKKAEITAKVRYSAMDSPGVLTIEDGQVTFTFDTPQRAATPGQSIVFYKGDLVVGGGLIEPVKL